MFLTVSSVSSFPSKGGHECPNCSGQYIKTIDPSTGKCVECWPCPKCLDGSGLSVPCGSTVNDFTKIHCVLCVRGVNFSDSSGTGQCQPCGVCAGKNENVLKKCTRESDVKCDCKAGFYRNKTNDKCLPCSSCPSCSKDDEIISKCKKDTGDHQIPWSSANTFSTSLPTVQDRKDGSTVVKSCSSTVMATSSALSSYSHYASTMPLLPGFTITRVLVPTRTQQIRATSTSVLEHEKHKMTPTSKAKVQVQAIKQNVYINTMNGDHTHERSSKKTEIIITVLSIVCVF